MGEVVPIVGLSGVPIVGEVVPLVGLSCGGLWLTGTAVLVVGFAAVHISKL